MSRFTRVTAIAALAASTALGGMSAAFADSDASGGAVGSPGVVSGNVIQIPIHIPVNVCGNTVDIVGVLNPAFGNTCINESRHVVLLRHDVEHRHFVRHHVKHVEKKHYKKKKHHKKHHRPAGGIHTGGGGMAG
ncbi:chaplin [Streptomyces endophytica]|uniref:chaplin n=1 Tax=Streptomyces endophytica TaxID=2991496 RepID=UPI003C6EFD76